MVVGVKKKIKIKQQEENGREEKGSTDKTFSNFKYNFLYTYVSIK